MKRPIFAYINEDYYKFIREYARQYIELGYKNWLGKALEDAIKALMSCQSSSERKLGNARTHKNQSWQTSNISINLASKQLVNRLTRIVNRINGKRGIKLSELLKIIIEEAGSDFRTMCRYLNLLQGFYGIRFLENNPCILYFNSYDDQSLSNNLPLVKIVLNPRKLTDLLKKCRI